MFDEEDLPNLINQSQGNPKYKVARTKQAQTFKKWLNRFFQQISKFFNRDTQEESLSGRIKELEASASEIVTKLQNVKTMISLQMNERLYAHSCALIDPVIKEVARTERIMNKPMTTAQEVKIFSRFVECVDRSKIWLELLHVHTPTEKIQDLVITQTILEFHARIDRDIQIVHDYLDQALNTPEMGDLERIALENKVKIELVSLLESLESLKHHPNDLSIEIFEEWRDKANGSREKFFTAALHEIDTCKGELVVSKEGTSKPANIDDNPVLVESIDKLEKSVLKLAQDFETIELQDLTARQVCLSILDSLEVEAHHLNGNLSLSHELSERVATSLEIIYSIRENF
jgi:hypothetical protein